MVHGILELLAVQTGEEPTAATQADAAGSVPPTAAAETGKQGAVEHQIRQDLPAAAAQPGEKVIAKAVAPSSMPQLPAAVCLPSAMLVLSTLSWAKRLCCFAF